MSKVHLIHTLIEKMPSLKTQEERYELLQKYEKEYLLKRIVLFGYNPWVDFKLQTFVPRHMGKDFGMGISSFMHIFEEIIAGKLDTKEAQFSISMAFLHISKAEAPMFLQLVNQTLDLGLTLETINRVWPNSISAFPIREATKGSHTDFIDFPASLQTLSKGLRINVIVYEHTVQYRQKDGTPVDGFNMWDQQFINLAQGQNTVFDGHAVVAKDSKIVSTDNTAILEADGQDIRFIFWDVMRYDGFITGEDTRIGYNWRYNGLEHMMMLAIEKNPTPCYDILRAEMVGSIEQLNTAIKNYSAAVIKSLSSTWANGKTKDEIISFQK